MHFEVALCWCRTFHTLRTGSMKIAKLISNRFVWSIIPLIPMLISHLSLKSVAANDGMIFNTSAPTGWISPSIYYLFYTGPIVCLHWANQWGNTLNVCWHRLILWPAIDRKRTQHYSLHAGDNLTITFLNKTYQSPLNLSLLLISRV